MEQKKTSLNFIEQIIEEDIKKGFPKEKIRFRFPPEPNGYLHIGHIKAICINFGLGKKYNAPVNLRFDDTNPIKEEHEFIESIKKDIKWLGFCWDKELYTSDYFEQLYLWSLELIKKGKAYIDDQTSEEITAQKKNPFESGIESPYRNRSVEKNLMLFERMKRGEGNSVLRAKIDMNSSNMNMRDPIMYRIIHAEHHRTQDKWKIYPMYDWAHGQSDYIEGISHSLCSLEFKNHRPLYEWYLKHVYKEGNVKNKQGEFARLNLTYTVISKRKLQKLVENKFVSGWDDPRMPTISGLRRRGYTPESLINFIGRIGVANRETLIHEELLKFSIREHLNKIATRYMAVLDPVKLIITNYPKNRIELINTENNPEIKNSGIRTIPFSRELYIERADFMENASKKFFRLSIGNEVRLKSAYIIKAESVLKDKYGNIMNIYATYDEESKSGRKTESSKRKVKGTLHWVSSKENIPLHVRVYDRLFNHETPDFEKERDFMEFLNPNSLKIVRGFGEINLKKATTERAVQFHRLGYFIKDKDSTPHDLIFNQTVELKDTWAKLIQ